MTEQNLFDKDVFHPVPTHRLMQFGKEDLIQFIEAQARVNDAFKKRINLLEAYAAELQQKTLLIDEKYIVLKNKFFGKSSEKEPAPSQNNDDKSEDKGDGAKKEKKIKVQLPSLRYPDAPLIERDIGLKELPDCTCCGAKMQDSGMTEDSEYLTVIPAQYMVIRQKRHKYRCGKCHGDIQTAPSQPRITPSSSMSDEMIIDVGLSKYCDLIPIERYSTIAGRGGLKDLPPQSLIESTHQLAHFVSGAYNKLREEILSAKVLHVDETPHRMLEGDKKSHWYLWGFSTPKTSYFEIHDTRSGDVASELLKKSQCEFLVSDVFSGYGKSVRETNKARKEQNLPEISSVYCNAHARRKFREAEIACQDLAQYFIDQYKEIYRLESLTKGRPPNKILEIRKQMSPFFEAMKIKALENIASYSSKSSMATAMAYFLKNYKEFTRFVENAELPIDNNSQERLLRSPVIGRKTWYGTHSKRGAETAAILFSLVESCKLNKLNPREYFKKLIADLHARKKSYTPSQYKPS